MQSFERDLLILINDVARMMRTRFDQRARTEGMTRAQWVILARLARQPGISQNELAAACEVEPITIGRLIDRLEVRGFVARRPDPTDRRIRRLHITPAAQPVLDDIERYRAEQAEVILNGVDKSQRELLVDVLLQIKDNLAAEAPESPQQLVAGG